MTTDKAPERIFAEMSPYDFEGYSPCWVWHHPESIEGDTDGAVEYVRADLAPDPLRAVKVKPLVWDDLCAQTFSDGSGQVHCEGNGILGLRYRVFEAPADGIFASCSYGGPHIRGTTIEAVRAAVQADYETRIRSALAPADVMADARVQALVEAAKSACDDLEQAELTQIAAGHKALAWQSNLSRTDLRAALASITDTGGKSDE